MPVNPGNLIAPNTYTGPSLIAPNTYTGPSLIAPNTYTLLQVVRASRRVRTSSGPCGPCENPPSRQIGFGKRPFYGVKTEATRTGRPVLNEPRIEKNHRRGGEKGRKARRRAAGPPRPAVRTLGRPPTVPGRSGAVRGRSGVAYQIKYKRYLMETFEIQVAASGCVWGGIRAVGQFGEERPVVWVFEKVI